MNYLIRLSALFAFALFGMASNALMAQDSKPESAQKIQLDEKKIEQWAEKNAEAWEKWGEKFESKMERWAADQEKEWEDWANQYSKRWEDWAEKLESGEIKPDEIQALVERNLEMLKDMPLESLIDGALKEGLGELKNAPFDSLSELHELIGGSLEQSLEAMEKELSTVTESEIKEKLKYLKTKDLHEAIKKLQGAIEVKQLKSNVDAADTISRLEAMLKKTSGLGAEEKDKIMEAVHRELSDARALQAKHNQDDANANAIDARAKAMAAADRAKEIAILAKQMAQKSQIEDESGELQNLKAAEQLKAAMAKKLAIAEKMAREKQSWDSDLQSQKASLERYYADLKLQKAELESKESAIEEMKREIQELRKEVERMKKQAGKKKD
jgi:hypothetical protein